MNRKNAILMSCALLASLAAHAQTYHWKDSSGRTIISDTPPPSGQAAGQLRSREYEYNANASQNAAEREAARRKGQAEAKEKAELDAKAAAYKAEMAEQCSRMRAQLVALESGQRIANVNSAGERYMIDDAERAREVERSRKFISESCK